MSSVLLVDDSPLDRALFRELLGRGGFRVHEVAHGRDVLEMVRTLRPQAVVLDVNLPDTDGHEVCRALRADPDGERLPVLMLTVRDRSDDVIAGLAAGADDYVTKDEAAAVILARLRRMIHYRQMANAAALNEQLVQVGRLLAGIVHEIRGPLTVIRGHVDLLRYQLAGQPAAEELIRPIAKNVQILQIRLEHLMAAVRGGRPQPIPVKLGPLVEEATELFLSGAGEARERLHFSNQLPANLPPALADEGRLILVLLNLFANARDAAFGTSPTARVEIGATVSDDVAGQEWIRLEIRDDGPGIPEAHLERIFEPYFTTKPDGTGFGLYLASEVLKEQGGRLVARNLEGGGGACFEVWLPTARAAALANEGS